MAFINLFAWFMMDVMMFMMIDSGFGAFATLKHIDALSSLHELN